MNMQFGLIKVFKTSNVDTLVSLPFWLILPALPLYSLMTNDDERRVRVNTFIRKVIHVVNVFVPTFIVMTIYLIFMMAIRYLFYIGHLFMHSFAQIRNLGYLVVWIVGGPYLLIKLFILDITTLCTIILDFSKPPCTLLDFELSQHARENLIKIFHKFNRVLQQQIKTNRKDVISVNEFISNFELLNVQDMLMRKLSSPGAFEVMVANGTGNHTTELHDDEIEKDFNARYSQDDKILGPRIIRKFAKKTKRNAKDEDMVLDVKFMLDKFRNKINLDNVGKLIAYEQDTLDKAKESIHSSEQQEELENRLQTVNGSIDNVQRKVESILSAITEAKLRYSTGPYKPTTAKLD